MIASPALAQKTEHRLEELAAGGTIDENAPVRASSETLILAPIDKVWKLLSAIDDWPRWQSTISSARTSGPLQRGTEFVWITGGIKIKSRLALVQGTLKSHKERGLKPYSEHRNNDCFRFVSNSGTTLNNPENNKSSGQGLVNELTA